MTGFYRRGAVWHVRTDPVTRRSRSTGCRDLTAAKLWHRHRERLAADPVAAAAEHAKLGEWCDRLLATKGATNAEYLRGKLRAFEALWSGACRLSVIGPALVDQYVERRRADGVADATIGRELAALTQVLALAKRSGHYAGDLGILRPGWLQTTSRPRTRALTRDEVERLLSACTGPLRAFVALVVATGARRSEALAMTPEDIGADLVRIPGTKTQRAAGSIPALGPYRPLLCLARACLPIRLSNVNRDLRDACKRAGIEPCSPNDLRRTHITLLREQGIDRDSAKQLLRHSPASSLLDRVYDQSRPVEVARRLAPVLEAMPALKVA